MLSPSAGRKKRLRGKKARARQRSRYDLRQRYRERDLPAEHIGIAQIEDPYTPAAYDADGNLDPAARLAPVQHPDGTLAQGSPAWTPPRRPTMTVFVALKDDPVGRMFARKQIDVSQYNAARAFQQAADRSTLGAVRSVDLTKTKVSGGIPADPLTDSRKRAMSLLRYAEQRVANRFGLEGLSVTRAVLSDRLSVEQTARARGASTTREISFWTGLFQRCLNTLAMAFGFATAAYRPRPANGHARARAGARSGASGERG